MSISGSLAKTNTSVGKNTSKVFNNGNKKLGKLGGITDSVSGIQKNVAGTVVGVGNIVAKAAGALGFNGLANSLTGSTQIKYDNKTKESQFSSGLRGFYNQFSGISLNQVDRVDPFNTFECEFRFFPNVGNVDVTKIRENHQKVVQEYNNTTGAMVYSSTQRDEYSEQTGDIKGRQSTVVRLLQNIQMRSLTSKISRYGEDSLSESETFKDVQDFGEDTITTYETLYSRPIEYDLHVDLGIYIQKVTLPNVQIEGGDQSTTPVGKFPIPGNLVMPDNTNFSMEIVNVQAPIIENVFYPWMRETTLPWWSYDEQPFTTATITFDFTEHSNAIYRFFGCRPIQIQLIQPEQAANTNLTRNVQFSFDFMTIEATDASKPVNYIGMENQKVSGGKKNGNSYSNLANGGLFSATNTLKF